MTAHFERGRLLMEQSRPEPAAAEFRRHLADEPNDPFAHAFLALCLTRREQYDKATEHARQAVHLAPDLAYAHFVLSVVLDERHRLREAQESAEEAIRLDPDEADYFAQLAGLHFQRSRWTPALSAAEQGLAIDPEHVRCTNLRAMALVKLGRKAEAGRTIDAALARNPENALTHANQGWTLLDQRKPQQAMEHFREALRLNPELEWARRGIIEAMKARHFIYRWMLAWFLWMAKLTPQVQWGVIVGGYFGIRALQGMARQHPGLAPYVAPVVIAYVAFALMTWVAVPLFNLLLRLSRFGRLVLSRAQIVESNWIGGLIALAVALAVMSLVTGDGPPLVAALFCAALLIPVSAAFRCDSGWPRTVMAFYAAALGLLGGSVLLTLILAEYELVPLGWLQFLVETKSLWSSALFFGVIAAPWVGNILASMRRKR